MKFSIERATLAERPSHRRKAWLSAATPFRSFRTCLIEAEGDNVSFRATDLDIEVVDKAAAMVERAGATTVCGNVTLHEIVRKLPDGAQVVLTDDSAAGGLRFRPAGRSFQLATLPKRRLSGDGQRLNTRRTFHRFRQSGSCGGSSTSRSSRFRPKRTRYYLNGVYMHMADIDGGRKRTLRCVATDGHRLARIDADLPERCRGPCRASSCRARPLERLRKLLDDDDTQIAVSRFQRNQSPLSQRPTITLTSKVIDGTFPDYTRVIPAGQHAEARSRRKQILPRP